MTVLQHRLFQQPWPEGEYRLFQLGFLVDDLQVAAARWARVHGVGPFHVMPRGQASGSYRGAASTLDLQVGLAQAGPVQIELIQQFCESPSVYRELAGKRQVFHQLCTLTSDYEGKKAHYGGLGYALACELFAGTTRVAFFDTLADFGFFTEVVEAPPSFLKHLTALARTCADWDGSDPVRLITRDGYRTP